MSFLNVKYPLHPSSPSDEKISIFRSSGICAVCREIEFVDIFVSVEWTKVEIVESLSFFFSVLMISFFLLFKK